MRRESVHTNVGRGGDATDNQAVRLVHESSLETVGQEAGALARNNHRLLAEGSVELTSTVHDVEACRGVGHNLDERDQMRWVERMPNEDAAGVHLAVCDELGRRHARRRRRKHDVGARVPIQVREHLLLVVEFLWAILSHSRCQAMHLAGLGPWLVLTSCTKSTSCSSLGPSLSTNVRPAVGIAGIEAFSAWREGQMRPM